MDDEKALLSRGKRARFRSFVFGGLVGIGTLATARRLRRPPHGVDVPAGLAAFEDAPCFLELAERDAESYRAAGGEIETGRSKPE